MGPAHAQRPQTVVTCAGQLTLHVMAAGQQ
jgi:hypothetical protein